MLKIFALFDLISFNVCLKETIYTYKAMTELKTKVDENLCVFVEGSVKYVKACQKGYTCEEQEDLNSK